METTNESTTEITAEKITYPQVTTNTDEAGTITVTRQEDAEAPALWEKTFTDGKKISLDEKGIEVTRYPNGTLECILPKCKKKLTIRAGCGEDVVKARRGMNAKSDEGAFTSGMYSVLCKFDGAFMIPEDIMKKLPFSDYILLETFFQEVNF